MHFYAVFLNIILIILAIYIFINVGTPIWHHLLGSWIQEVVTTGYIKKLTIVAVGRGSGWLSCFAYESSFYVGSHAVVSD